jgi:hypothetical protein
MSFTDDVWIADNPPERSYSCPKCNKGVKAFRVGNSSSYVVKNADDNKDHACGYIGFIPNKLLGYRPPSKDKKEIVK